MNDYEALLHQAERLEALQEIRNLIRRQLTDRGRFQSRQDIMLGQIGIPIPG